MRAQIILQTVGFLAVILLLTQITVTPFAMLAVAIALYGRKLLRIFFKETLLTQIHSVLLLQ